MEDKGEGRQREQEVRASEPETRAWNEDWKRWEEERMRYIAYQAASRCPRLMWLVL